VFPNTPYDICIQHLSAFFCRNDNTLLPLAFCGQMDEQGLCNSQLQDQRR
jgi:hypothetical protein